MDKIFLSLHKIFYLWINYYPWKRNLSKDNIFVYGKNNLSIDKIVYSWINCYPWPTLLSRAYIKYFIHG